MSKKSNIKEEMKDFTCDCTDKRCGTMRFLILKTKEDTILDTCFIPYKRKKPTEGIVIRGKNYDKLLKFLNKYKQDANNSPSSPSSVKAGSRVR